jgi:predicted kinase
MYPLLIVISGLPCTGKTTLGRWLAGQLNLPLFSKDAFKEMLFDTVGWSNREWSKKLSRASNTILLHLVETLLGAGISAIVESNFDPVLDAPHLRDLLEHSGVRVVQVYCTALPEVIEARFQQRVETATRHPGHVDATYLPDLRQLAFSLEQQPLDLGGVLIKLDTTVGDVDYAGLLALIVPPN